MTPSPKLQHAIDALYRGEVITYPTEAVWGLGCDPDNAHAVSRILTLKHRAANKGLILVAADISQVEYLLSGLDESIRQKMADSWPGHVTWLVPHNNRVSPLVRGEHDTVAIRVSAHPVVRALCFGFGGPIVSTSANPQSLQPAHSMYKAKKYFGGSGVVFCPGRIGAHPKPSQIIDARSGKVLRS